MTRARAVQVLRNGTTGAAFGLTWVPAEALRFLTWQGEEADPAETLAAVASEMQLDLAFVPAHEPWAEDAVRLLRHVDVAAAWVVSGVLGRAAERTGLTEVVRRSAREPGALAFLLSEVLHEALEDARKGESAQADVLVVADDLAGRSGWLVAPDFALEALLPCYKQLSAETLAPVVFHSDGDIRAIYPALSAAGFCGVHVAVQGQHATERAFRAARETGLVPVGGIEGASLLRTGANVAGEAAAALAARGAAIVCDDGGMTTAEDLAAYTTAIAAAKAAIERGV